MNISKRRTQGFTNDALVRTLLDGLKRLLSGERLAATFEGFGNPKKAFTEAARRLTHLRSNRVLGDTLYQRVLPYEFGLKRWGSDPEKEFTLNELPTAVAHQLIHEVLAEQGFTDSHISTFTLEKLRKLDSETCHLLDWLFPMDKDGRHLIITARSENGHSILIY